MPAAPRLSLELQQQHQAQAEHAMDVDDIITTFAEARRTGVLSDVVRLCRSTLIRT